MPTIIFRPKRLDFDRPTLLHHDDATPPGNVRILHNLVQLAVALVGGVMGALIALRHWQTAEAGLVGAVAGLLVATFGAAILIHLAHWRRGS